jgi:tetratricopeptide (TPR) repeat protein
MNGWERQILAPYVRGLHSFLSRLDKDSISTLSIYTYEQRLIENIRRTSLYGNSAELGAERSEIVSQLNRLAYQILGASFNELCGIVADSQDLNDAFYPTGQKRVVPNTNSAGWHENTQIAATYEEHLNRFFVLANKEDYDEACHLYWYLSNYIGTREIWGDCALLSNQLLKLSSREADLKTKGLVLVSGKVWPLLSKGQLSNAKTILVEALSCFQAAGAGQEIAVFYKYMAAIEEAAGNIDVAVAHYKEALVRTSDTDAAHKINLKRMFAEVKAEKVDSKCRVVALQLLREQFKVLNSYREAMVLIELAKSLNALKSVEAVEIAQHAFSLLNDEIMMPSNAAKAKRLLDAILQRQ